MGTTYLPYPSGARSNFAYSTTTSMTNALPGALSLELVLARSSAADLRSVRRLNAWHQSICDISVLRRLPNLEILNLSSNLINDLSPLQFCPSLKEVYLRRNEIGAICELKRLQGARDLRALWLSGNPLCRRFDSVDEYRKAVIRFLPQLTSLDNVEVSEEERSLAMSIDIGDEATGYKLDRAITDDGECASNVPRSQNENAKIEDVGVTLAAVEVVPCADDDGGELASTPQLDTPTDETEELLVASLRFSLVETNAIREFLELKPIETGREEEEEDQEEEKEVENKQEEEDLDSSSTIHSEATEDGDFGDGRDLEDRGSMEQNLFVGGRHDDDYSDDADSLKLQSESGNVSVETEFKSDALNDKTDRNKTSLLKATLLLLKNLSADELRMVEEECRLLRREEDDWV